MRSHGFSPFIPTIRAFARHLRSSKRLSHPQKLLHPVLDKLLQPFHAPARKVGQIALGEFETDEPAQLPLLFRTDDPAGQVHELVPAAIGVRPGIYVVSKRKVVLKIALHRIA